MRAKSNTSTTQKRVVFFFQITPFLNKLKVNAIWLGANHKKGTSKHNLLIQATG
jgi:hypothetical protein